MKRLQYLPGKTVLATLALIALVSLNTHISFADGVPSVTSFTASAPYINNNYSEILTWTATNSTGSELYIDCPPGVTLKRSTGTSFPCNLRQSYSSVGSDYISLVVTNVSGGSRDVKATVYPKNASNVAYDAGAMNTSFSVGTSAQPILSFTASPTSIASGDAVTLTWKAVDTSATNIQFNCVRDVQIIATSPAVTSPLPCGVPAFSTNLAQSGTATIKPVNSSSWPADITALIFPVVATGSYDGTHSLSATVTVAGKPAQAYTSVTSLTSSQTAVVPGSQFTVSWATANSTGANMQVACNYNGFSVVSIVGTTSVPVSCNTTAFASTLPGTGTTTFAVVNNGPTGNTGTVSILLFPKDSNGTYLGTAGQTISLKILAPSAVSPAASVTAPPSQTIAAPSTVVPPVAVSAIPVTGQSAGAVSTPKASAQGAGHYTFTKPLQRGSRNADVTALQTYLAQDPIIYPDAIISGYFGALSEKAVGLFQEKYGIMKKGGDGYGMVGPKTRAKLNSVQ